MDLSRVIYGPVVTEKAERLKAAQRTYVLQVAPSATKVDVRSALQRFYDVEVSSVRVLHVRPKSRMIGQGTMMEKRHKSKRMLVTLAPKSKALDLGAFQIHS